jgi:3-methyl-2-oxobutanoate hydroxymethyltransferase
MPNDTPSTPITWTHLQQRKAKGGQPWAMLTAYDFTMAKTLDAAGIEVLLVGDSLAMTMLGHANTLSVTMEEMLHHTKAVVRGRKQALVLADAPFMSYHISEEQALTNLSRFIKEADADGVKVEGATPLVLAVIRRLSDCGIPVVAHLGLQPQAIKALGQYKLQAKTTEAAETLQQQALAVQAAGAVALVLELVPASVAASVTQSLTIPTIGIGAGAGCDAQVLVVDDMLGRFEGHLPRFVRRFADLAPLIHAAASAYRQEVANKTFPNLEAKEGFS